MLHSLVPAGQTNDCCPPPWLHLLSLCCSSQQRGCWSQAGPLALWRLLTQRKNNKKNKQNYYTEVNHTVVFVFISDQLFLLHFWLDFHPDPAVSGVFSMATMLCGFFLIQFISFIHVIFLKLLVIETCTI